MTFNYLEANRGDLFKSGACPPEYVFRIGDGGDTLALLGANLMSALAQAEDDADGQINAQDIHLNEELVKLGLASPENCDPMELGVNLWHKRLRPLLRRVTGLEPVFRDYGDLDELAVMGAGEEHETTLKGVLTVRTRMPKSLEGERLNALQPFDASSYSEATAKWRRFAERLFESCIVSVRVNKHELKLDDFEKWPAPVFGQVMDWGLVFTGVTARTFPDGDLQPLSQEERELLANSSYESPAGGDDPAPGENDGDGAE